MGIIVAIRVGFVPATYPPSSASSWGLLVAGWLISAALAAAVVWRSQPTVQLKDHPGYVALMILSILVICVGLIAGLGFTPTGINIGGENASVRTFAVGASFGAVALFGLGSHRAARMARIRLADTSVH